MGLRGITTRLQSRAALRRLLFAVVCAALLAAVAGTGWLLRDDYVATGAVSRVLGAGALLMGGLFLVAWTLRVLLWARYRPMAPTARERADLPDLTVVIPAFNEGEMVRRSIESVLASDYPADRLRIVAVNDGSKDDTGAWIDTVAARHPERVRAVHMPVNRGKRHALYEGFRRVRTALVATVDSDSVVPPDSLAHLVTPMARDERIGGVAGKVVVHNRRENILTRMLGVRYILGFDFVRAYQSELRTVWCCPGALQAYRMDLVRPHLDAWLGQTFLGASCTNGDDHAMTNLVLSLGADTVYQANAPVETLVPSTYSKLCKMYVRWGRSATREGLRALRFAWHRALGLSPLRGPLMLMDALLQPLTIALQLTGAFLGLWVLLAEPAFVLQATAATTAFALAYCLIYLRSERSVETLWGLVYAWYAMVALAWVQPFATLTVRRNGWMTRD
ncbi:MAG: glycosyltransferase family 2 protein [Myxococcota bacterium]